MIDTPQTQRDKALTRLPRNHEDRPGVDRLAAIQKMIDNNEYDTDERMDAALEALMGGDLVQAVARTS